MFTCNGRSWFVQWCSQGQLYLEFKGIRCTLQIMIFCRSCFLFVEPVFFPKVRICQSRWVMNIFPSDSHKPKIFTWNLKAFVVFYRLWYFADPVSFSLNWFSFQKSEFANLVESWIFSRQIPINQKSLPGNIFGWVQK